jgi:hypothetical protein
LNFLTGRSCRSSPGRDVFDLLTGEPHFAFTVSYGRRVIYGGSVGTRGSIPGRTFSSIRTLWWRSHSGLTSHSAGCCPVKYGLRGGGGHGKVATARSTALPSREVRSAEGASGSKYEEPWCVASVVMFLSERRSSWPHLPHTRAQCSATSEKRALNHSAREGTV